MEISRLLSVFLSAPDIANLTTCSQQASLSIRSVLSSTVEHPATRSACARWAKVSRKTHILIAHDDDLGLVKAEDYTAHVTRDTKVATILHTSPVTGMGMDVAAISEAIRAVSPDCYIIVDGIQHAAHGHAAISIQVGPLLFLIILSNDSLNKVELKLE